MRRKKGAGLATTVGVNCGARSLGEFGRATDAGVRDGIWIFESHVLLVTVPEKVGLGTLIKMVRKNLAGMIPHDRINRSQIRVIETVNTPPPGWRLIGDVCFLHCSTLDNGDIWFWVDQVNTDRDRLANALLEIAS